MGNKVVTKWGVFDPDEAVKRMFDPPEEPERWSYDWFAMHIKAALRWIF
jgi:hypothetical protein